MLSHKKCKKLPGLLQALLQFPMPTSKKTLENVQRLRQMHIPNEAFWDEMIGSNLKE